MSKTTKVTIYSDRPVSVSSSVNGANVDSICFSMAYIVEKDPKLAKKIIKLFEKAKEIE